MRIKSPLNIIGSLLFVVVCVLVGHAEFLCAAPSAAKSGTSSLNEAPSKPVPAKPSKTSTESFKLNEKGVSQIKARDFKGAEISLKRAVDLDPGNITAVFNLASAYMINKKESAAVVLLKEYTAKVTDDAGLWVRLGDGYFGTKEIAQATAAYEKAFKLAPDYDDLASKLSTVYLLANKNNDAEKMLELAVEKSPRDQKLLANLSSLYLGNGKPEKSVSAAKKALQIKATKEVYVTLASAYEIMKDYKNSLIAYQRAVDLGEDRDEVHKKIEGLKEVVS